MNFGITPVCSSALRLCVRLFDDRYIQIPCPYQTFLFALRTVQRKIQQNGILSDLIASFTATNRAAYPFGFVHLVVSLSRNKNPFLKTLKITDTIFRAAKSLCLLTYRSFASDLPIQ